MTPGMELKGGVTELLELCGEIHTWRDPIFSLRPEYEHEATTISLPPEGENF